MVFSKNVYKIRLWSNSNKTFRFFVFIGNDISEAIKTVLEKIEAGSKLLVADTKKLEKKFGENYKKILGIDIDKSITPIFIYNYINHDDNINIVTKKIVVYLNKYIKVKRPEDIYLWAYKNVVKDVNIDATFISNCFKKDSKLSFEYFNQCVFNYFGKKINDTGYNMIDKQIALNLIKDIDTDNIIEPIIFKYVYDGFFEYIQYNPNNNIDDQLVEKIKTFTLNSYTSLILSFFEVKDNTLEMIIVNDTNEELRPIYFPLYKNSSTDDFDSLEKFIKQLDGVENEINHYELIHKYEIKKYITFLSLKGNEINFNNRINLSLLFDKIHTNKDLVFAKYKSLSNIFYKIHKESIGKIDSKDMDKWTIYKSNYGKIMNTTFIIIKFKFSLNSWVTLNVSDILGYDIKFNCSVDDKVTIDDIYEFYKQINKFLKTIILLYPDESIPLITKDNIKIINLVTYNVIGLEKKTVKFDNIETIITNKMYPYFNIIPNPDKNILHLQYKKVDNYIKYDNIQMFITQHFGMPKEALISKLMELYVMSKDEAEKEYNKWSNKSEVEFVTNNITDSKPKFKAKNDNFVNLKLKINEVIDTKFIITGLKNYHTQDVLCHLIEILLDFTNQKIKKTNIDLTNFDAQMFNEQPTNIVFNDIDKDILEELTSEYDDNEDDYDYDIDAAFSAIDKEFELEMKQTENKNVNTNVSELTKKGKTPGPVLGYLKEADSKLFDYPHIKGKKRTDFPSSCGWTDTRQPMVINEEQKNKIDKEFPEAYDGYIKTGSTKELAKKNYYICPKIWCPKSKVAISYKDYQKHNNKCPYPEIEEEPVLFNKPFWGKTEADALNKKHYVGFLKDSTHPNHFCLPCCFKLPPSDKKKKQETCKTNYISEEIQPTLEKIVDITVKDKDIIGNEKYIKGEHYFPLEAARLGLLPKELTELLGNKKCGSRHDGTGLLDSGTKCFLRKGINHFNHSFISCVIFMLNLPFKSDKELLNFIIDNLNIQKYLALENGKIIRLFINNNFDIYNQKNFKEFHNWFLKQNTYIKNFNLYKIKKDLEKIDSIIFNKKDLITYKDIIREFMIYNSFKHFIEYLQDEYTVKDHRTLLDLINTEHQTINTKNSHIIIVDVDTSTNKTVLLCPFNRNVKELININNPFVFIIKNNDYYEPLSYIEYNSGTISAQYEFIYEDCDDKIKNIINYYLNNCGNTLTDKTGETIALFLESIGYKTRSYVIDFSFRIKGLLLKENLFIPFKNKLDIYNVSNKSYIYFNDITDFKCLLSDDIITDIFEKLQTFTEDSQGYYEIDHFIVDNDDEEKNIAVKLKSVLVPLQINRKNTLFKKFENDLDIFIETQVEDKRTKIMKTIKENSMAFEVFFQSVTSFINNDEKTRSEITFLTDLQNPFPKNFRREKLLNILENISKQVVIKSNESVMAKEIINDICDNNTENKNCVYPCDVDKNSTWNTCLMGIPDEYMQNFVNKMIETLLLGRNVNLEIKVFSINLGEVLLDQHDINNNKINDIIEYQRNPFKLLSEKLEDITDQYIFDKNINIKSLSKIYIQGNTIFDDIPVVWRKYLKTFNLIKNNKYNSLYLYSLFININEAINPNKDLNIDILKSILKTRIIHDYTKDTINNLFENESFLKNLKDNFNIKKLAVSKPSLDIIFNIIDSINYFPSVYEIKIMANIVGINLIIIGRKNKNNVDGLDIINNNSNYNLFLNNTYDRDRKLDQFDLYVKNEKTIIFKKNDIPENFYRIIENKKQKYKIDINTP